jgi:hypothetical protein
MGALATFVPLSCPAGELIARPVSAKPSVVTVAIMTMMGRRIAAERVETLGAILRMMTMNVTQDQNVPMAWTILTPKICLLTKMTLAVGPIPTIALPMIRMIIPK